MKVYDYTGRERDWKYLTDTYGNLQHLLGKQPGFNLIQVNETEGPTEMKVQVLDENGIPVRVMVVLTWPELANPAADLPDLTQGDPAVNQWTTRGIAQFTDGNGFTGFGLGSQSWVKDLAAGGPYHVWIFHNAFGSDCLSRIGWLGGTNHRGPCFLTFRLNKGTTPPDPDDDGDATDELAALNDILAEIRKLNTHLGVG